MAVVITSQDLLASLIATAPREHRREAERLAFTAWDLLNEGLVEKARIHAAEALKLEPLNPWALYVMSGCDVYEQHGGFDAQDPDVQARRLPGLLAFYAAGEAVAIAKMPTLGARPTNVWNMMDGRAYQYAAIELAIALDAMGHGTAAEKIRAKLEALGVRNVALETE